MSEIERDLFILIVLLIGYSIVQSFFLYEIRNKLPDKEIKK